MSENLESVEPRSAPGPSIKRRAPTSEATRAAMVEVLENTADSFIVLDERGRVSFANDAAVQLSRRTQDEIRGQLVWEVFPELETTLDAKRMEHARKSRSPITSQAFSSATQRWLELNVFPVENGMAIFSRDVTARKQAEALREELAQHAALRVEVSTALSAPAPLREMLQACCEAIVRSLGVAFARIWTLNENTATLELQASGGMYTHIDGPHGRVPVGQFKIGLIAAERQPHLTNSVLDDPRVGNKEWARKEGMASFAGYPLTAAGRLIGVMAMFGREPLADHTLNVLAGIADAVAQGVERKRAEDALRDRAQELARSNAELEQFAYVASHDLQEPLRMVASYTQLLGRRYKGKLDSDADDFIGFAVEGVGRMQRLIQDLLAYSRVGTRVAEFSRVECDTALENAKKALKAAIDESGAVIEHDDLPAVFGDELQLTQVFQNLLGNAIKFRGTQPPNIHVGATVEGRDVRISVRDNGIGIGPAYWERIFVIFQRLHAREDYPGTGIGLAICRKIVERHGGRIWVESEEGKGSTVHFTLASDPSRTSR